MLDPKAKPAEVARVVAVFRAYEPELHRYLTKRIRRPADVQDLMQEIFQRFVRLSTPEHVRNAQAYLYRVASNLVGEFYKHEITSPVTYDSEAVAAIAESEASSAEDDMAEQLALQQALLQALQQLPPMHRAVLILIKRDGRTYEEAAQQLGLELSTVTKYLFEARAKMKMLLKRGWSEAG